MRTTPLLRQARGLFSQFNQIHGIPEGGLLECMNLEISRNGVLSKIRGRNRYGSVAASVIVQQFEYLDRLFRHHGTTLDYDSDGAGTFTALAGSYSPPNADHRLRAVEDELSLLFTTSLGVFKKATLADTPIRAGVHEALDLFLSTTGTGAGIFPTSSQVAYRVTWKKKDANERAIEGTRSWREILANSETAGLAFANAAGTITVTHNAHGYTTGDVIEVTASSDTAQVALGSKTITVTGVNSYTFAATGAGAGGTITVGKEYNISVSTTIPTGIVAGDFLRIYRTEFSASSATAPGDEMLLVEEYTVTAGDITAGVVTYTDAIDEAFLGEPLYSNATAEGPTSVNNRPPWAVDLAEWKSHLFAVNLRDPHALEIQLLTVTGLVDGTSSLTITDGTTTRTYTFAATENIGTQSFKRFTTGTAAENVEDTMKSFCKVLNRDTGQSTFEARYVSEEEDAPGIVEIRRRSMEDTTHSITCNNSTTSTKFTPNIPTSGSTYASSANAKTNGLRISKFEQPEHFPSGAPEPVGPAGIEILRAIPLRDSLLLICDVGIYRVSGETDKANGAQFSITQLDPSVKCVAPDTWVVLNNAAFGLTTQGVVKADETGVDLVSQQIEDDLKRLFAVPGYRTIAFAVPYESAREYRLHAPDVSTDTTPTLTRVYNWMTNTWTDRDKHVSAGHVMTELDRLYEAHQDDKYTLEERKNFLTSGDDHRDEDLDITITAIGTAIVDGEDVTQIAFAYSYDFDFQNGFFFQQGSQTAIVESFTEAAGVITATLDQLLVGVAVGAATISLPINSRARWRPEANANAAVTKQFPEIQLYFEANDARFHEVGFSSDVDPAETFVDPIEVEPGFGWGETSWGDDAWGDEGQPPSTPIRVPTPRPFQRCGALSLIWEHTRAAERCELVQVAFVCRTYDTKRARTPR